MRVSLPAQFNIRTSPAARSVARPVGGERTASLHFLMAARCEDAPVMLDCAVLTHVSQQTTMLSPMLIIPGKESSGKFISTNNNKRN